MGKPHMIGHSGESVGTFYSFATTEYSSVISPPISDGALLNRMKPLGNPDEELKGDSHKLRPLEIVGFVYLNPANCYYQSWFRYVVSPSEADASDFAAG